jgi:adenosylcobinamide-phosphate synthase
MTFLAILLALVARDLLVDLNRARAFGAYQHWVRTVEGRFRAWPWNGPLGVVLVLFPLPFATAILHALTAKLFPPLAVVFDAFVLLFCLGPGSLADDLRTFEELRGRNDEQAVRALAGGLPISSDDPSRAVLLRIPAEGNRRILAVLLWFSLLAPMVGPFGAALYRLAERVFESLGGYDREAADFRGAAARLFTLLNWLPARVTAYSFALVGGYQNVIRQLTAKRDLWLQIGLESDIGLLAAAAEGALGETPSGRALGPDTFHARSADAVGLVRRTMWLWVGMTGAMTVSHWLA